MSAFVTATVSDTDALCSAAFSCFLGFLVVTKKKSNKQTKKPGTLTEQLKAGRLEQDRSEMHQQQQAQGPEVDKASPPVVDSRRTRTRRCDGHLPSFHAWKQRCPLMWRSGQEIFHLASMHGDRKGCHLYLHNQTVVCASSQIQLSTWKRWTRYPLNISHVCPAGRSVPDWLSLGPTHMAGLASVNRPEVCPGSLSPCITTVEEIWILYRMWMQIYGLQRVFFSIWGPGNYGNKTLGPCFCGRRRSNLIQSYFPDYSSHLLSLRNVDRFENLMKCCQDVSAFDYSTVYMAVQ